MKKVSFWVIGYWLLLIINVLANQFSFSFLIGPSKVFLMPFLTGLLFVSIPDRRSVIFNWTLVALFFSWLGDIFLIFQDSGSQFFLLGLGAFLLAQLTYASTQRLGLHTGDKLWAQLKSVAIL